MTLKLQTIVDEMGRDWVDKKRHEAREHFHYNGRLQIDDWIARYVRTEYNLQKARAVRDGAGRVC